MDKSQIISERVKSHDSLGYFIDTYCKIQDRKSFESIPFKLWPGQKQVLRKLLLCKLLIALKARQLGITWLVAAYVLWRAIFHFNELIIVISAKEDLAIEFLDRVKFMFDRLPDWLKPKVYKRTTTELSFGYETTDSEGNLKIGGLNSNIKSIPSTADAGQSKTISLLVLDESALNRYCKEIWGSAKPTLEHASGQAIIISNPSKDKPGWGWTRDLYVASMRGLNEFDRMFLNWQCVPGRGENFLELQRLAGFDDDDISMQYPTTEQEAISSLGGSYFGNTLAKFESFDGEVGVLVRGEDNSIIFHPETRGIVEIWEHPVRNFDSRYAIGSDVSEGTGNTYSVAYVYDRFTNQFVARLRSSKIAADVWAQKLIDLADFYGHAMIGPERNGAGITTVIYLQANYDNLFFRQRPGKMKGQYVMEYGWLETEEAKQILSDGLKTHFRDVFQCVPCALLLDECSTYIRHDNGKLAHEDGKFDDCVIAAGITLQVSKLMPSVRDMTPKEAIPWTDKRIDALYSGKTGDDFEDYMVGHFKRSRSTGVIADPNLRG